MPPTKRNLFLPELIEEEPGQWQIFEANIREAKVDLQHRQAWVPQAFTPAQRLARLHELGHVKYTPRHWTGMVKGAIEWAEANGETIDPTIALAISKMLEENRIDWLLWDRHGIDLRPAREVLDWEHMQVPTDDPLTALQWVLQLAWTVWATYSHLSVPNPPPVRGGDRATAQFFDASWAVVTKHNPDLAKALIRGCMSMYAEPTHERRNAVAAELATFFPPPEEQLKQPPPEKPEEQQAQAEAAQEEEEQEQAREEEEIGGVGNDTTSFGHYEIHDHTAGIRRPSMRLTRKDMPYSTGTRFRFPHRYMLDKSVFARRMLTEGGIMVDGSGSMHWSQDDLSSILDRMPAIWVGIYSGWGLSFDPTRPVLGRVCVLAKHGRFSRFDGLDSGTNGENDVDLEALWLLAQWPKPRFWLSDGYVMGGRHVGPHPDAALNIGRYVTENGALIEKVNRFMKAHEILRIQTKEDMHSLFNRRRVTLYRSCINRQGTTREVYPPELLEQPILYQL